MDPSIGDVSSGIDVSMWSGNRTYYRSDLAICEFVGTPTKRDLVEEILLERGLIL